MTTIERENLPLWMQKTLRGTDWGALIVIAFSLLAAWSFLLQSGLPRTNADEHYAYRTANTAASFVEGRLYPRWSPNVLGGYGAPIPNYTPPAAAYLPALIDVFVTNEATLAVRLVYVLAFIGAGAAVYAFVLRRSGAVAGVIAALLYVYSPYVGLTVPHLLGDLPGMISLALIPALFWSVDRLLRVNRPADVLIIALITAGLAFTDLRALGVGWLIAVLLIEWNSGALRQPALALISGVLGFALAACFWLPALVEANAVQMIARPRAIPFTLALAGLLTPLHQIDPSALIAQPQFTLGIGVTAFAIAGTVITLRTRQFGFHRLFLVLSIVLTAAALIAFPGEVWLLGAITLCWAITASAVVHWSQSRLFSSALVIVILAAAIPIWLAPRWNEPPLDTSPAAQVEYEQQGYGIAGLPAGDPLPSTISPDIGTSRALIASYQDPPVNKVVPDVRAQVGILEHATHGDRFQVQTFSPLTLHVLTADFLGWSAAFNDISLPLQPDDAGLISIQIPAPAQGELDVSLKSTPGRSAAWGLTWLALIVLIAMTVRRSRTASDAYEPLDLLDTGETRLFTVILVVFTMTLALVALPNAPIAARAQPFSALDGSFTLDNRSDAGLEVLAYRLDSAAQHPGSTLKLTLYWHTLRFLTDNYQVRVSLLDLTTGQYRLPTDLRQPGDYPTARWLPRTYVSDPYAIPLPDDLPSGQYSPALEVFACSPNCESENRLTFFDRRGSTYGQVLVLPIVIHVE